MSDAKRVTVFQSWKKFYQAMGDSLDTLEETYDAITTHPRKPGLGENIYRDHYFQKLRKVVEEKSEARFRRIMTVTTASKYQWIEDVLKVYRRFSNFNLAYFDQLGNYFPLIGMIIFDRHELYLTSVFSPQAESIYIRIAYKPIVGFFFEYFDRLWAHDIATKIKVGTWVDEPCLRDLQKRLGTQPRSLDEILGETEQVEREPYFEACDIQQRPKEEIRLAIVQLDLVDTDFTRHAGRLVLKSAVLERKLEKLPGIIDAEKLDVLCLPELSMVPSALDDLSSLAKKRASSS